MTTRPGAKGDSVDVASLNEVKAFAELVLNNFASSIIHSAVFPEYPVRGVEETIRFHLRHSPPLRDFLMESFDRFQLAGLDLICLKNETKAGAELDLRDLISAAGADVREKTRRERLLRHLESADQGTPAGIGKVQPGASRERLLRRLTSSNEIADCRFESRVTGDQLECLIQTCAKQRVGLRHENREIIGNITTEPKCIIIQAVPG